MVSITPNRGYPFPECDPPLVKDASDISQLRDLAEAIDADATAVETRIEEYLEKPDAIRLSWAGNVTGTGFIQAFTVPYDTITYDNTPGSTDLTASAVVVRERGLYLCTSYVRGIGGVGNDISLEVAHAHNGIIGVSFPGRRFEGLAGSIATTNEQSMTTTDAIMCFAGDTLQTQARFSGVAATSVSFEARLSVVQLYRQDVA